MIIFPLNLHTITITLDVVKWRRGGTGYGEGKFWLATGRCRLWTEPDFKPRGMLVLQTVEVRPVVVPGVTPTGGHRSPTGGLR